MSTDQSKDPGPPPALLKQTAETRLQTLRVQLAMGFTMCTSAERAFGDGHVGEARKAISAARRTVRSTRARLTNDDFIPAGSVPEIRQQLQRLEKNVRRVEDRLR